MDGELIIDPRRCYGSVACITICPTRALDHDRSSRRGRDAQVHALWAVPCILSSTCYHPRGLKDDTYRRRRTHRTGGDLRQLLNRGFDITLIEARAEIGLPTRIPRMAQDSDLLHELPQDLLESSEGVSFGDGFGFRRGWFDRRLAQHLGDGGVRISTRTEVVIRDGDPSSWRWACRRWSNRRAEGPGCTRIRTKPPRIRLGFRSPSRPR